uniref:Uncharacterized protein n=1 Tax=Anopheles atroparvus TaxID=41427 RepID=A0A182JAB5_ANOAO
MVPQRAQRPGHKLIGGGHNGLHDLVRRFLRAADALVLMRYPVFPLAERGAVGRPAAQRTLGQRFPVAVGALNLRLPRFLFGRDGQLVLQILLLLLLLLLLLDNLDGRGGRCGARVVGNDRCGIDGRLLELLPGCMNLGRLHRHLLLLLLLHLLLLMLHLLLLRDGGIVHHAGDGRSCGTVAVIADDGIVVGVYRIAAVIRRIGGGRRVRGTANRGRTVTAGHNDALLLLLERHHFWLGLVPSSSLVGGEQSDRRAKKDGYLLSPDSSSQQAEQVQLVACGVRMPSSMSVCKLRPPYRIERFQSLLDPRPQMFSNSLGVYQVSLCLMHFPRPPEPSRLLYSSPVVVLQRTCSTSTLARWLASALLLSTRYSWVEPCWEPCCWPLFCDWLLSTSTPSSWSPALCCWMTMWVCFSSPPRSPTTVLLETNPLLSTHIIGLKCCIWSEVSTLKVAPPISVPTGRETGTCTTCVLPCCAPNVEKHDLGLPGDVRWSGGWREEFATEVRDHWLEWRWKSDRKNRSPAAAFRASRKFPDANVGSRFLSQRSAPSSAAPAVAPLQLRETQLGILLGSRRERSRGFGEIATAPTSPNGAAI